MVSFISVYRRTYLLRQGGTLLSISRIEFLALLRARGISYINYTPDELTEEFAAVKALQGKPNVTDQELEAAYRRMAQDKAREAEALEWTEATVRRE